MNILNKAMDVVKTPVGAAVVGVTTGLLPVTATICGINKINVLKGKVVEAVEENGRRVWCKFNPKTED